MSSTGGPPLTRKSQTPFPLPRFLAHVCGHGGISVSRGPQYTANVYTQTTDLLLFSDVVITHEYVV